MHGDNHPQFHRCLSVHSVAVPGQVPRQAGTPPGQAHPQACTHPARYTPNGPLLGYGQQAGGTHPTGIHFCFQTTFQK